MDFVYPEGCPLITLFPPLKPLTKKVHIDSRCSFSRCATHPSTPTHTRCRSWLASASASSASARTSRARASVCSVPRLTRGQQVRGLQTMQISDRVRDGVSFHPGCLFAGSNDQGISGHTIKEIIKVSPAYLVLASYHLPAHAIARRSAARFAIVLI